jgi:hypothetical protein
MSTATNASTVGAMNIDSRVDAYPWSTVSEHLDAHGWAMLKKLLTTSECQAVAGLYADDHRFRSHIVMARHGFGRGEYKYFTYPLPDTVADLRTALYPRLTPIANRWNASMGIAVRYPDAHPDFLARCHKAGQTRPTPLLLQYGEGDFNALHQDLHGEHVFPLQVAILLSEPEKDFTGRVRADRATTADAVAGRSGAASTRRRRDVRGAQPARAGHAWHLRMNLRHGVSRLRSGHRHTVGVIFHDAK